ARKIEFAKVPLRILEHDELEEVGADRERFWTTGGTAPAQLAARLETRKDAFARLRIGDAGIELSRRFDLRCGQAVRCVAGLALRDCRIDMATERLADQS